MDDVNGITIRQNGPHMLELLRARARVMSGVKFRLAVFILASTVLPVLSVLVGSVAPQTRPYFAAFGILVVLVDAFWLEHSQKDRLNKNARLQEEFDTCVLDLPWNKFVAGSKVDPEDVRAHSARPLSEKREVQLWDWYNPLVSDLPMSIARIICQRTNITYDGRLRKRYGAALITLCVFGLIGLLAFALADDLQISGLVLTVLAPAMPIFTWAIKEYRKQIDGASLLVNLKSEVDQIWAEALTGADEQVLATRSRQLQDALFQHRASSPPVFDWVYQLMRRKNEDQVAHGAAALAEEARHALQKVGDQQ